MKLITVTSTWEASCQVEVPDDYEWTGGIDDVWAGDVTAHCASLVDWEVHDA